MTLQDGGPNDADGQSNGVIKDPGGIGLSPQAADDVTSSVGVSASGGGCVAATGARVDPLLPLLVLLSALGLVCRRSGYL